jgi:hypothetical protein
MTFARFGVPIPAKRTVGALLLPPFRTVSRIVILGSSYAESCMQPVLCGQKRPLAECGCGPVQTPCNADGWICRMPNAHRLQTNVCGTFSRSGGPTPSGVWLSSEATQRSYPAPFVEEGFCELLLNGVLRSWSGRSCNVFNFRASNSLARAFVESNKAAKRPL